MEFSSSAKVARIGVFVSLALVGSFIKIPSPIGSPALDSAPGYFSSLAFGAFEGSMVAVLGHVVTGLTSGFPLGLLHGLIAVGMGGCAVVFRYVYERVNLTVAVLLVVIMNGIVLPVVVIPGFGVPLYVSIVPSLVVASVVNSVLAGGIYVKVKERTVSR